MYRIIGQIRASNSIEFAGRGLLAGQAPDSDLPGAPDGRFKILNVPARGRVVALERSSGIKVKSTMSAADGTWLMKGINPELTLVVIGFDDRGLVNAAIQDWVRPFVPEP